MVHILEGSLFFAHVTQNDIQGNTVPVSVSDTTSWCDREVELWPPDGCGEAFDGGYVAAVHRTHGQCARILAIAPIADAADDAAKGWQATVLCTPPQRHSHKQQGHDDSHNGGVVQLRMW